ncbi:MAG: hypothetical protein AAGE43_21065, partial [Pseudomonadota bacterium]
LIYVAIIVMVVAALWVFWPYDMNRERHAEIRAALEGRSDRGAAAEAASNAHDHEGLPAPR